MKSTDVVGKIDFTAQKTFTPSNVVVTNTENINEVQLKNMLASVASKFLNGNFENGKTIQQEFADTFFKINFVEDYILIETPVFKATIGKTSL